MKGVEIGIEVCVAIGVVLTILSAYEIIFLVVGMIKHRKFASTKEKRRYGICVAARNEEKVIANFLESVARQDYPLENLTVFIVAHNCTDNTAKIARTFAVNGLRIVVYEHNAPTERTKGYALKALFEKIAQDFGIESFDGYFVFDADNLISENYVTKMNEAFVAGNKIVTSFRASKNMHQNWISYGYAMHWLRTCLTENRGKGVLNQACRIQGTGFLFANELVKDGWKYTSLTEDRSFCTDAVIKNYRISYCDEAVFYDEQPYSLKVALRQRLRWAKGHLQSTVENCPKLLLNMFKKDKIFSIAYDCFWLNFPKPVESGIRRIIKLSLQMIFAVSIGNVFGWWMGVLTAYVEDKAAMFLQKTATQIAVFIIYQKRIDRPMSVMKLLFHVCMFPFFDIIGKWSSYVALFKKVEWKPVPHDRVVNVETLKKG